jgi:hypothetical protein
MFSNRPAEQEIYTVRKYTWLILLENPCNMLKTWECIILGKSLTLKKLGNADLNVGTIYPQDVVVVSIYT